MEFMLPIIVGGFAWLFVVVSRKQEQRKREWQATATELGLSFQPGPHSDRPIYREHHMPQMYGQHDGQDVYLGIRTYTTGSGSNTTTHYRTFVDVVFDVPLKRGIDVERTHGAKQFFEGIFGSSDVQVGDASFDKAHTIKAFEARQAQELLNADVKARLCQPLGDFYPSVTDTRVRLEVAYRVTAAAELRPLLPVAVELFRAVKRAWQQLPDSEQEALTGASWRAASAGLGLEHLRRGMVIHGDMDGLKVFATVEPGKKETWTTRFHATFDPPLAADVKVTRAGLMSGVASFFGAQDIKVGHEAFDKMFVVKCRAEKRAREALTETVCEGLMGLADKGEPSVFDNGVEFVVPGIVSDADDVRELLVSVAGIARAMIGFRRPQAVGAYR